MSSVTDVTSRSSVRVFEKFLEKSADVLCQPRLTGARHRALAIGIILTLLILVWLVSSRFVDLPSPFHEILYLPIFLGALIFGMGGGVLTAIFAAILLGGSRFVPDGTIPSLDWNTTAYLLLAFGAATGFAIDLLRWALGRRNERFRLNSMTGLPNTIALAEQVDEWVRCKYNDVQKGFHIALVQVPGLEEMTSLFGDGVIKTLMPKVAASIQKVVPSSPGVYQFHYDRLAVLLPDQDVEDVKSLCEKICATVPQKMNLNRVDVHTIGRGTVGISHYPTHGNKSGELIRAARFALGMAIKKCDAYSIFDKKDDQNQKATVKTFGELQEAIGGGQLLFHYQPKLNLRRNAFTSVEALARWNHPSGELLSPAAFLSLAENTDVITRLSAWALKTGISQLAAWQMHDETENLGLAVNLSAMDLRSDATVRTLKELLTLYGINPARLEIEVTETTIIDDIETATRYLQEIKALGVHIAVDDFGTGHAGLKQLRDLPVDSLKIDQTFVKDLLSNPKNDVIVRSAIQLGHNLGLKVVAEGVESKEVLARLREYGCDVAQGFLLARPMPEEELRQLISLSSNSAAELGEVL